MGRKKAEIRQDQEFWEQLAEGNTGDKMNAGGRRRSKIRIITIRACIRI